ncbi:hypothetical protein PCCS19_05250 [Paenibacillus sp. CCS19]|uniref:YvrJ family protein n=1 Tax=Paenibacillus sp. CCS19 TaxID=3158387 RepID=UPI00256D24BA|nr:YvrJ family protein [Paenibacillus cellulosilyticus]GMK37471.1 hypothetical protein PCCS19_05250 [Paenibacillus cellulosilyticus]
MDQAQTIAMVTTTIGNMGFPIVVAGYLLLRFEKKIDALTGTLQELMHAVSDEKVTRSHDK